MKFTLVFLCLWITVFAIFSSGADTLDRSKRHTFNFAIKVNVHDPDTTTAQTTVRADGESTSEDSLATTMNTSMPIVETTSGQAQQVFL